MIKVSIVFLALTSTYFQTCYGAPEYVDPRNVAFSAYIDTSMTTLFAPHVALHKQDPSPPTSVNLLIDGPNQINVTVTNLTVSGLSTSLIVGTMSPVCFKEGTFTVNYCMKVNSLGGEARMGLIKFAGDYTAEGVIEDGTHVTGNGKITAESAGDMYEFICQNIEYSNVSVSLLGKVDITEASYSAIWADRLGNEWPWPQFFIYLSGLDAGHYNPMVEELIVTQFNNDVGHMGKGNPLSELVDSFLRSLLLNSDSSVYLTENASLESSEEPSEPSSRVNGCYGGVGVPPDY